MSENQNTRGRTVDTDSHAVRSAVQAAIKGDAAAFGVVVSAFQRRIYGLCLMITKDAAAAEDVAQDAFIRAYSNIHKYDTARSFYPWLATIAVRLAQNWLKARARRLGHEVAGTDMPDQPDEGVPNPLGVVMQGETSQKLWLQVAGLPAGQRTAVTLHYQQDLAVLEVAAAMGVTEGTVKTLLFRARQTLKKKLSNSDEETIHDA
ncbi:MAG: RNA polymerase sigma factor [Alphaproteobacteria bacterium]|nr:RNA polymerase sigma factor [Alphaproteobacteria bacterium]